MTKRRSRRSIERSQGKKRRASRRSQSRSTSDQDEARFLQALSERFIETEVEDFEEHLARLLRESATLREEPGLADLYFPGEETLKAAARRFPRFKRPYARAARRGPEAAQIAYDEYRIAVIEDLAKPQFRDALLRGLEQCKDRFMRAEDLDGVQMSVFIAGVIRSGEGVPDKDKLPLGVVGLVTVIYEASFDRAMETVEDARERISGDLYEAWCAVRHREDMAVITAATKKVESRDDPAAFTELVERVETNPDLALAWERQEGYLIEELRSRIPRGGLGFKPLPFKAEVKQVMDRVEQRALSKPWHLSRYVPVLALPRVASCAREALDEHMKASEIAAVERGFEALGQACLESDDEEERVLVPHMVAAVRHLRSEAVPSRNAIVQMMFSYAFVGTLMEAEGADRLSPFWRGLAKGLDRSFLLRILTPNVG